MLQVKNIVKTYVTGDIIHNALKDIITHISVMERTKEIGILRALGASKSNI